MDINFKIDDRTGRIIMMGAIDNLVKGAAGSVSYTHLFSVWLYGSGKRVWLAFELRRQGAASGTGRTSQENAGNAWENG